MSPIDGYLNVLCWAMGGSLAEQQAVRDELRAHVRAAARDMELQGLSRDDALRAALAELGEPEALGRELRASRGTRALRRPLVQPEGAIALEHHRTHTLPNGLLLLALGAWSLAAAASVIAYLWPS